MRTKNIEDQISRFEMLEQLTEDDYRTIQKWASSSDAYARNLVAELLVRFPSQESEQILLRLTEDRDTLVRANAYDSLSEYHSEYVLEKLKKALEEEPDDLARSYAILSCADVANAISASAKNKAFFQALRTKECVPVCQMSYDYALYFCGDNCAHMRILPFLNDSDYHVRCFAISTLGEISDSKNIGTIKDALLVLQKVEDTVAVQSAIKKFYENMDGEQYSRKADVLD